MNKNPLMVGMIAAALAMPFAVGCDKTVSETETKTTTPAGTETKTNEKVTEKSDGTMVHEASKTVDREDAPDSKDKVKIETNPDGSVKKVEETHK
jgi:hypothetical protein